MQVQPISTSATMEDQQHLKLTVTLRGLSFAGRFDIDGRFDDQTIDERLLAEKVKRQRQREEQEKELANGDSDSGLPSWSDLKSQIISNCSRQDCSKVEGLFHKLLQSSKDLTGIEEDIEQLQEACVFLYQLFRDSPEMCRSTGEAIKAHFGPYPAKMADTVCSIVNSIVSCQAVTDLPGVQHSDGDEPLLMKEEFRHNLKFTYPDNFLIDVTETLLSVNEGVWSDQDDTNSDNDDLITKGLMQGLRKTAGGSKKSDQSVNTKSSSNKATTVNKFGGVWLERACQSCNIQGLSWQQLHSKIFDLLLSDTTIDVMESELVELLGFEQLDFIQDLLVNRSLIVDSILNEQNTTSTSSTTGKPPRSMPTVNKEPRSKGPAVGSMITVQTSEEKELKKQLRKEEKKDEKLRQKREKEGMTDDGYDVMEDMKLGYDTHVLRMERESALEDASRRPLFSAPAPSSKQPSYPNVFDSLAEVKKSTSFIAGQKIVLPESTIKKDNSMYEEIKITAFGKEGPPQITERVVIKELDDIIKMAFPGTKSLNIIQSQVFPTAYCSNENMLISAPTGAGKTNIAMLTVLNEIKNNIGNDGVIKKDQFKIIYVAPMKALAGEMVANFGKRLSPLGISVKELTGDMQMTKQEIQNTNMIVTTPEKWDVVTRKSTGDVSLAQIVKLLIIDEVHLLHEDRGAVIECLVARTLRQVESSQRLIRIVGLSATLPNYIDVARFLRVNPMTGLFVFDERFRPVPLSQSFVGIKARSKLQQSKDMDTVCYDKCYDYARHGYQVMVFVHSRNGTVKTATTLKEMASTQGDSDIFRADESPELGSALKQVESSRYKPLKELFPEGFAVHHAGMLRHDRNLVERLFTNGLIKVLVCTATLAWGVNLPAHAVIIKGTQLYDAKKGAFIDLGILDVCQIFGRAGRPQFDTHGEGTIITSHDKLSHYLSLMTRQNDIESQLTESLADALNAEISLGTISNVNEAVQWLKYTYLYVRLQRNPLAYGIDYYRKQRDPFCEEHCRDLVMKAAMALDKARMTRFMEREGTLNATDVGRTASHYYIKHASIEIFNELLLKQHLMTEADILAMTAKSQEFEQIKVREDEVVELEEHLHGTCMLPVKKGGVDNPEGKVNILLQTYIGRGVVNSFSLVSDLAYVAQNSGRITKGLFEICLKKGWSLMAYKLLELSKCIDHQMWHKENPLKQFNRLSFEVITRLQEKNTTIDALRDMTDADIGHLIRHVKMGKEVKKCVDAFPTLSLMASIQPITRTVLRVNLRISPDFTWDDRIHGNGCESWWVWVEDPNNDNMYHSEYFLLHKKQVVNREPQELVFTIPIFDPLPPQYYVKATSDRWIGSQSVVAISFKHLILPELHPPHTTLLDLHPLPVKALANKSYESIYKFKFFNPIQTQTFHTLYHSDTNVLLGAPTGSGKTVAAEIAMFRVFNHSQRGKCVYIAPLKALVRERIQDWKMRLQGTLKKKVIELTGDTTPDIKSIKEADVIVTTPEKWDGISRSWQNRSYVQDVRLIVIDEIHLLGDERGPVLEVIVSRTNFIGAHTSHQVRVVGLSTALANASDLASWLGISPDGLFNFHPAVRPVQLEVHVHGYPGKHYCPRMATMNKPCFTAISTYSPRKPVLIFVSSRRQTRLTAFDLVSFMATADNPKQWLNISEEHLDSILQGITDTNLRFSLSFGIGIHHAGLKEKDRKCVEELFVNQKIQILIATATLAWGVNFPAHLVIVKGTEYFDGKTQRYVDYPITDVLQMMGRAGRPQYDDKGVAMILVHDVKKDFYKKFLYEPFPVESNLLAVLADHLNAEIVAGTISTKQEALDYITWTYFFQRLVKNPSYYQLEDSSPNQVNQYLTKIVNDALMALHDSYCISFNEDNRTINSEVLGCISSFYYLHHKSVKMFKNTLRPSSTMEEIVAILSEACEYNELPVRHNEDKLNAALSANVPLRIDPSTVDSPHTKAFLLLQAHFGRVELPIVDYITDTKSVLDQALRILQACLDISANEGWLQTTLIIMGVVQMCCQGRWSHDSSLLCLPHIEDGHIDTLNKALAKQRNRFGMDEITCIPELLIMCKQKDQFLQTSLGYSMAKQQLNEIQNVLNHFSLIKMHWSVIPSDGGTRAVTRSAVPQGTDGVLTLACGSEYILEVKCQNQSKVTNSHRDSKAYTPRFPKTKDEGWWLILGIVDTQELVAMKRVGYIGRSHTHRLIFEAPPTPCHTIYSIYLISDCYLGLDQQVDMKIATIHNE